MRYGNEPGFTATCGTTDSDRIEVAPLDTLEGGAHIELSTYDIASHCRHEIDVLLSKADTVALRDYLNVLIGEKRPVSVEEGNAWLRRAATGNPFTPTASTLGRDAIVTAARSAANQLEGRMLYGSADAMRTFADALATR